MEISCLKTLALNILKNASSGCITEGVETPELDPCPECNDEIFLYQLRKSFTVLACGHIFHRLCLENIRETITKCPVKNCGADIESIEKSPQILASSRKSMSIDKSGDSALDPFLGNDPSYPDTMVEDPSENNQSQSMESDIPGTSSASTLPSKRVGDPTSADKPSNKKPKTVNREDSSNLKKLINELSSTENSPQVTGIIEENAPSEKATIFLYLFSKIDRAESRNEVTNREVINSYFNFGEALKKRRTELKKNNSGSASGAILNRELRDQIPITITKEALRKRTEKARKIYKLFDAVGKEKINQVRTFTASSISRLSTDDIDCVIVKVLEG
ncbi:1585_t:CDS:1 [Entrophospora sp. SA101]|nr:1585_t:CDS:1 [Entrophospora sp. SA101]